MGRRIRHRSIPACAGEPYPHPPFFPMFMVYPRVCGGTSGAGGCGYSVKGLSPRVRGNRGLAIAAGLMKGSIPACAGEPVPRGTQGRLLEVYPRVCGGTTGTITKPSPAKGLSPRVRGNHIQKAAGIGETRSIPACAGEPHIDRRRDGPHAVYPRVCGGTLMRWPIRQKRRGLSPRVRGNHPLPEFNVPPLRSIPACAGEPCRSTLRGRQRRVYPRVCGGTSVSDIPLANILGLSPRVRGNRWNDPAMDRFRRSIPACAGEPLSVLYLFPPLLRSYSLIVLHQVDPVSIDYLLRLLSQYLNSLAAYRRRLPPGHYYRSLLHLGIPPSQYFPDPPPYAACHVWRRVYAGRYLQHCRGQKTSITRCDIDRNHDCHLLPPSPRRARRLASLR